MNPFRLLHNVPSVLLFACSSLVFADEEEEVFEYNTGGINSIMGEGADIGGFLFPELYFFGTGGLFEPGSGAADFASSEHDPLNDLGIQAIEVDIGINWNDVVTGLIAGVGFQAEEHVWEAELEEAFLHFQITDNVAVGGGQFLNRFGFQSDQHLHGWYFVNQNLVNSRILNEGHLTTQGGEILLKTPSNGGLLTLGGGGVRRHGHSHSHEHGEEEHHEEEHGEHDEDDHDDHDDHDHEEHGHEHIEADEAGFNDWVFSADYRFRLPFDDSITATTSFAAGENGFGRNTYAYGFGFQKVWNGQDHGNGGPDFCTDAVMLRSEFIGRDVEAYLEDGDAVSFDDYGISTSLHWGVSEQVTLSLRHDWVSAVEMADLADRHRISPALTTYFGPGDRIRARIQYDYTQSDAIGGEHAAWLQFQVQWGGTGGSHAGHGH